MPLLPKKAACLDSGETGTAMSLKPRLKSKLVPRLATVNDKKSTKPISEKTSGLKPKSSAIKQIKKEEELVTKYKENLNSRKKKPIDHKKNFDKWYKVMEDGAILLAEEAMGRSKIRILFNTTIEHFLVQYVGQEGKASSMKMTFPVAIMRLLRSALRRAEKSNIIKRGYAIQPEEKEE